MEQEVATSAPTEVSDVNAPTEAPTGDPTPDVSATPPTTSAASTASSFFSGFTPKIASLGLPSWSSIDVAKHAVGGVISKVGSTNLGDVTDTIAKLSAEVGRAVEENTIIGDFNKAQREFEDELAKKRTSLDSTSSWITMLLLPAERSRYDKGDLDELRSEITRLSSSEANILGRDPPEGSTFDFRHLFVGLSEDESAALENDDGMMIGKLCLAEDERLEQLRYSLVPKRMRERQVTANIFFFKICAVLTLISRSPLFSQFWRNYFYGVWLAKQAFDRSVVASPATSMANAKDEPADASNPDGGNERSAIDSSTLSSTAAIEPDDDSWEEEMRQELEGYEMIPKGQPLEADDDVE